MILDPKKAKTAELEAEIALFREAGAEDIADAAELDTNKKRIIEIERLTALHGYPVRVDAGLIASEPHLAAHIMAGENGAKEGEIVFVEESDLKQAEEAKAAALAASGPENTPDEPKEEPVVENKKEDLVHAGKTVVAVRNVVQAGKLYKEVEVITGETFRLTEAEFTSQVKPR